MSGGCAQGPAAAAAVPGTSTYHWRAQARLALPVVHQVGELVSGTVQHSVLCSHGDWREGGWEGSGQKEPGPSAKLLFGLITTKLLMQQGALLGGRGMRLPCLPFPLSIAGEGEN